MDAKYLKRIYWRITGAVMVIIALGLLISSYFAGQAFEREVIPEIGKKAVTVGASLRNLVERAMVDYKLSFDSLYGVDEALTQVVSENAEFASIALADPDGRVKFKGGNLPQGMADYAQSYAKGGVKAAASDSTAGVVVGGQYVVAIPVVAKGTTTRVGTLHIGVEDKFVKKIMLELLLDVLVIFVVALFFTLELLNFTAGARLEAGLQGLSEQIERVKQGDFSTTPDLVRAATGESEIDRVLARIQHAVKSLNEQYQDLTKALHARMQGSGVFEKKRLIDAVAAWDDLRKSYKFGSRHAAETRPVEVGALNRIRAPLFAFILAEELTRSFLPSYIKNLLVPIAGISPQIVISLPIVLFMLIVAIGQPYLGGWSERIGRRRAMVIGASIAAVGFVATAFAYGLYDLLLWRSLCAIGYAMVFVAAQGYVLDHSGPQDRARGFALFVGAIMVATVCGPATGGILADNIGARYTFLLAAFICILSVLTIMQLPDDPAKRGANLRHTPVPTLREIGSLCLNRRFMVLTGLAAIPAKIVLTGFCFYLVPLYILSLGSTQAMAGRMLLVYAVIMVILVPIAAGFSDAGAKRERFVALGLIVSGLGGLVLLTTGNVLLVFVVVIFLGLGQAVSIASQGALVEDLCGPEIAKYGRDTVYGVYRLLERMGNAVGPLLASVLVIYFNYQGAFVAISALVLVCGVLFALATLSAGKSTEEEAT